MTKHTSKIMVAVFFIDNVAKPGMEDMQNRTAAVSAAGVGKCGWQGGLLLPCRRRDGGGTVTAVMSSQTLPHYHNKTKQIGGMIFKLIATIGKTKGSSYVRA